MNQPEQLLELGTLYRDRGDFVVAISHLQKAADLFLKSKNHSGFIKSQNLLLRLYAEREQFEDIQKVKDQLQDLVLREGLELNSRTYYTLALCASYCDQEDSAFDYLQKALALGLASDNKEDICYAISGTAFVYFRQKKYNEALKEIYNLQVFFQVLKISELIISSQILNAMILSAVGRHEQAIEVLWQAYDQVRASKSVSMHIYVLANLGSTYLAAGDKHMARLYFNLAAKALDPVNMIRLNRFIQKDLAELGDDLSTNYDLVFESENHSVLEKKLGKIDFKNQFILLDLLRLFMRNQGQVYSKEYLVEQVWKQDYDPSVHDNKIYVTIKRLRKMIEPDYDKPKYIFRAKNGYFMNKSAKILIDSKGGKAS